MRSNRLSGSLLAGLTVLSLAALAVPEARTVSADSQRIYVTVLDDKGKPVSGLTKEDFTVRLDARTQEVLSAEPAHEGASVVILTDRLGLNSTYTPFDVGQVLGDFVKAIRTGSPDSRIALTTFDGPVLQVARFTSAPAETERALGRLSTNATEAVLFDGLRDACRSMSAAPTDRRIIFALLAAYRPDRSTVQPEVVGEQLRLSGASLWVVEVRQAQGANYGNPVREQVLDAGSALSGGLRDVVSSRSGVSTATKRAAELILGQYALTFGPGGGTSRTQLTVQVKRPDTRVLAPRWTTK